MYVPSNGYDNLERVEMTEADDVEVADRGAVSSFTVITPVQYYGQKETDPYIRASILLDGADQPITGVDIRDIPFDAVPGRACACEPSGSRPPTGTSATSATAAAARGRA